MNLSIPYENTKPIIMQTPSVIRTPLKTFNDILNLCVKSTGCLMAGLNDADRKLLHTFVQTHQHTLLKTCHVNIPKIYIAYHSLSPEQRTVFLDLHRSFQSTTGSINCIDAGPGTGKTFMVCCLALTSTLDIRYLVYTRKLAQRMMNVIPLTASTCCKFIMGTMKINYMKSKYIWSTFNSETESTLTAAEKCRQIMKWVMDIDTTLITQDVLILDEDSVVSPWFLLYLYCISRYYNKHIIFIGDRYQQNSINKTIHHNGSNYAIIYQMVEGKVNNLVYRIRQQKDQEFQAVLHTIYGMFEGSHNTMTEYPMKFNAKLCIYRLLQPHFNMREDFNATFMSQYHMNIKKRMLRYEQHLKTNTIKYNRIYIMRKISKIASQPVTITEPNCKFLPYIIMVKNEEYVYVASDNKEYVVIFKGFISTSQMVIQIPELGQTLSIVRQPLTSAIVHEEYMTWLRGHNITSCMQFPIRMKTMTYHAAQGNTISLGKIELDLDTSSLNSFYVGITRILERAQIGRIHTEELLSLALTHKLNDAYYYRCATTVSLRLPFQTIVNPDAFNRRVITQNIKILRSVYDVKTNISKTTDSALVAIVNKLVDGKHMMYEKLLENI
ncbi:helicase 2 [Crangon crangon nudivirus]|uniref:Helicase 2 n=1 Tax=Crangon crangon nudivirus TaxID=2880838 RepID=A0AAE9BYR2_9VIRU|nr:helicase 2 [Crangon crangon nudivirus]UBZ25574.1 helicase 2 [Crangon crangon nudivirus]